MHCHLWEAFDPKHWKMKRVNVIPYKIFDNYHNILIEVASTYLNGRQFENMPVIYFSPDCLKFGLSWFKEFFVLLVVFNRIPFVQDKKCVLRTKAKHLSSHRISYVFYNSNKLKQVNEKALLYSDALYQYLTQKCIK